MDATQTAQIIRPLLDKPTKVLSDYEQIGQAVRQWIGPGRAAYRGQKMAELLKELGGDRLASTLTSCRVLADFAQTNPKDYQVLVRNDVSWGAVVPLIKSPPKLRQKVLDELDTSTLVAEGVRRRIAQLRNQKGLGVQRRVPVLRDAGKRALDALVTLHSTDTDEARDICRAVARLAMAKTPVSRQRACRTLERLCQ